MVDYPEDENRDIDVRMAAMLRPPGAEGVELNTSAKAHGSLENAHRGYPLPMPARLAQQDNENGMMEAACPQAVRAGLVYSSGVGHPASIQAIF